MIEIHQVPTKELWQAKLAQLSPHTFLHSWNWADFNETMGNTVWKLGIYEDSELVGLSLIIKVTARRGSFLFCPHGPLVTTKEQLHAVTEYVKILAKQENVPFIRYSPLFLKNPENIQLFVQLGFRNAPIHMHSELMWLLDITPSEDALLANMRKTTRYSIRKAQTDGVEIETCSDLSKLDIFYSIYTETVQRHNFVPFSKEYIQKEFEAFAKDDQARFFFGKHEDQYISASMVLYCNGSGFYHQGASISSKVPVTYLAQWTAIQEAKRRGCRWYNFWGIAPENQPNHPWAGLTLFKQGFGGFSEEYIHAQDLVLSPKYWTTYLIEKVRKAKRGL